MIEYDDLRDFNMTLPSVKPSKCFACGSISFDGTVETFSILSDKKMDFYCCNQCSSLTAESMDRSKLYERNEANTNFDEQVSLVNWLKSCFLRWSLRYLNKPANAKKTALDYGCGSGEAANILAKWFQKVDAVDVQNIRPNKLNSAVGYYTIENLPTDRKFDVIVARHVLEHVEDPQAVIEALARTLTDSGQLWIEVPNARSVFRKLMGGRWTGYFTPYHIGVFDELAFEKIAEKLNLNVSVRRAEPAVFGIFFMHIGVPRWIARYVAMILYPMQLLISYSFGTSEAILCQFQHQK